MTPYTLITLALNHYIKDVSDRLNQNRDDFVSKTLLLKCIEDMKVLLMKFETDPVSVAKELEEVCKSAQQVNETLKC